MQQRREFRLTSIMECDSEGSQAFTRSRAGRVQLGVNEVEASSAAEAWTFRKKPRRASAGRPSTG
jgi:hypothetical protein